MTKQLLTTTAILASLSGAALAEGLERSNFSSFFLFEEGTYMEAALGAVDPSLPATLPVAPGISVPLGDVADGFVAANFAAKTQVSDNFALGVSFTSQGNGVNIDWTGGGIPIAADVSMRTLSIVGKYDVSENFSVIGGLKQVSSNSPSLILPVAGTPSSFAHGSESGEGAIIGIGYERPEIAMRVALTYETKIDLAFPVTGGTGIGALVVGQATQASIGDALNLQFQTGIAQNTLLFGNLRYSMWEDNQVFVPTPLGPGQVSTFEDGYSISLGIARRLNEQWAVSASLFFDPGDGAGASELSPQGGTSALSIGARHTTANGLNIDMGATYSKRGAATTGTLGANLNDSKVLSAGIKVSTSF